MKSEKLTAVRMLSVLLGLSLFALACDNPASPQQNKKPQETVTEEMFDKIKLGMTLEQVNEIIGFPGEDTKEAGTSFKTYVWGSGLTKHIQAEFFENKAQSVTLFDGRRFIKSKRVRNPVI